MQSCRKAIEVGRTLYELGYPVTVQPYMAPSGLYWRCSISLADQSVTYSSSAQWTIFGVSGCDSKTPLQIAREILPQLGVKPSDVPPLWGAENVPDRDLLRRDWYYRAAEALGPNGFWSEFSDYGGHEVFQAPVGSAIPEFKDVANEYAVSKTFNEFLMYPERHALADAAKQGQWEKVDAILNAHPTWINLPRPHVGQSSKGYTPLHQAAYLGSMDAVKKLIQRGANLTRTCVDGTPAQVALKQGHKEVADFLSAEASKPEPSSCSIQ